MIETTVSQRRVLDSERQRKETQDQRKAREVYLSTHAFETCSVTTLSLIGHCGQTCRRQVRNY